MTSPQIPHQDTERWTSLWSVIQRWPVSLRLTPDSLFNKLQTATPYTPQRHLPLFPRYQWRVGLVSGAFLRRTPPTHPSLNNPPHPLAPPPIAPARAALAPTAATENTDPAPRSSVTRGNRIPRPPPLPPISH